MLVSRGHLLREIINDYSLRKINALYKAALQNQHEEMQQESVAVRYGMNANAQEFDKWLKTT
jgi:hypothetical protein